VQCGNVRPRRRLSRLIALLILFGAAAYFTGRLYGNAGMAAVIGGFFAVVFALWALGGISF
jgi:hypothetical protein